MFRIRPSTFKPYTFEAHPNSIQHKPLCALVPGAGFEPARSYDQRILSPQRLPFRHPGVELITSILKVDFYRERSK